LALKDLPRPGCETIRIDKPSLPFLPRVVERSIQWAAWTAKAGFALRKHPMSFIQCHSLAALPASVATKLIKGVPLIYDAHELETERPGWGAFQKTTARLIERNLIRFCDHTFTVSDSINRWYETRYKLEKTSVVRNVPQMPKTPVTRNRKIREAFGIPDEHLIFIYLGIIGHGRGYNQILGAFRRAPKDRHIIFLGQGTDIEELRQVQQAAQTEPNIHWHPPVRVNEVIQFSAGADVGVSLIEDVCLSYRYCLPNKVHECRLAGLPVIVSDLPEMARFVDENSCGWKVAPTEESLLDLVATLTKSAVIDKSKGATAAPLTWQGEEERYLAVVGPILRGLEHVSGTADARKLQ